MAAKALEVPRRFEDNANFVVEASLRDERAVEAPEVMRQLRSSDSLEIV